MRSHTTPATSRPSSQSSPRASSPRTDKALIFDELRPTPELSFAVRHYGCIAGINITASHNPKEYNGYKVYWEDGAQLPPAEADVVAKEMAATDIFTGVKTTDFDEAVKSGMIRMLGKDTDEAYLGEVIKVAVNPDCVKQVADDFKLVYTVPRRRLPSGSGNSPPPRLQAHYL